MAGLARSGDDGSGLIGTFVIASSSGVAVRFYRDVVSTCARACREPAANIREMKDFVKRYEAHWADCTWQPE